MHLDTIFMKNHHFFILGITFLLFSNSASAQKIKDEEIKFTFHQLPSKPLSATIKNYQSLVIAAYEAKNEELRKEYVVRQNAESARVAEEERTYPARQKEVQDRFDKDMVEYKKLDGTDKLAERMITGNAPKKPVFYELSKPYYREPSLPKYQTTYDYKVLADTYVKLEGFDNLSENAVKISVTLYGFDFTEPRVTSQVVNVIQKGQTQNKTVFSLEYSYRHPMSVKVEAPDGTVLLSNTPQKLNSYTVFKSGTSEKAPTYNRDLLVKDVEQKILQKNLTYIDSLVNDLFGFASIKRTVEINYVKGDDPEFADLKQAFNEFSSHVAQLGNNEKEGLESLKSPIGIWEKALNERKAGDKKARINDDVALALMINLLEGYYLTRDTEKLNALIQQLNKEDLGKTERKRKEGYDLLLADLKKRLAAIPK